MKVFIKGIQMYAYQVIGMFYNLRGVAEDSVYKCNMDAQTRSEPYYLSLLCEENKIQRYLLPLVSFAARNNWNYFLHFIFKYSTLLCDFHIFDLLASLKPCKIVK